LMTMGSMRLSSLGGTQRRSRSTIAFVNSPKREGPEQQARLEAEQELKGKLDAILAAWDNYVNSQKGKNGTIRGSNGLASSPNPASPVMGSRRERIKSVHWDETPVVRTFLESYEEFSARLGPVVARQKKGKRYSTS